MNSFDELRRIAEERSRSEALAANESERRRIAEEVERARREQRKKLESAVPVNTPTKSQEKSANSNQDEKELSILELVRQRRAAQQAKMQPNDSKPGRSGEGRRDADQRNRDRSEPQPQSKKKVHLSFNELLAIGQSNSSHEDGSQKNDTTRAVSKESSSAAKIVSTKSKSETGGNKASGSRVEREKNGSDRPKGEPTRDRGYDSGAGHPMKRKDPDRDERVEKSRSVSKSYDGRLSSKRNVRERPATGPDVGQYKGSKEGSDERFGRTPASSSVMNRKQHLLSSRSAERPDTDSLSSRKMPAGSTMNGKPISSSSTSRKDTGGKDDVKRPLSVRERYDMKGKAPEIIPLAKPRRDLAVSIKEDRQVKKGVRDSDVGMGLFADVRPSPKPPSRVDNRDVSRPTTTTTTGSRNGDYNRRPSPDSSRGKKRPRSISPPSMRRDAKVSDRSTAGYPNRSNPPERSSFNDGGKRVVGPAKPRPRSISPDSRPRRPLNAKNIDRVIENLDEDYMGSSNGRSLIWTLVNGARPPPMHTYDYDSDDMEAGYNDIAREEARSRRIARKEDEEEEMLEQERMKRKSQRKKSR